MIECSNNKLSELNVDFLKSLQMLDIRKNMIEQLDIRHNHYLSDCAAERDRMEYEDFYEYYDCFDDGEIIVSLKYDTFTKLVTE
jgi:hypothetical protein